MAERDQRRDSRHTVRAEGWAQPLDERMALVERVEVTVQEVGRSGLLLMGPTPMKVGTAWRVVLIDRGDRLADVPVVVRHCRGSEEEGYSVGCQVMLEPFVMRWLGVDRGRSGS